jgi:hypothetical protein
MRKYPLPLFILLTFFLAGCSRVSTYTWIKPDGSFTRKIKIEKANGMETPTPGAHLKGFALPEGEQWKRTDVANEEGASTSMIRSFEGGAQANSDIVFASEKATLKNSVVVRKLSEDTIEFTETYKGTSVEPPTISPAATAQLKAKIQEVSKILVTDTEADKLESAASEAMIRFIFGPVDGQLMNLLLHPDGGVLSLKAKLGSTMLLTLEEVFGDRMTLKMRKEVVRSLLSDVSEKSLPKAPKSPESDSGADNTHSILVSVEFPGDIIESNGTIDAVNNSVHWTFLDPAATFKRVVLRAVCKVQPQR